MKSFIPLSRLYTKYEATVQPVSVASKLQLNARVRRHG